MNHNITKIILEVFPSSFFSKILSLVSFLRKQESRKQLDLQKNCLDYCFRRNDSFGVFFLIIAFGSLLLFTFFLSSCTKSVNTASSDKFKASNPQADTLAIKRGLSIEDYLKEEQKKSAESDDKVFTESLWNDSRSSGLLFVDHKAHNVGDIITIDIIETSNATKKATTSTSRDSSIDAGLDSLLGLPTNFGMKDFLGSGQPFSPNVKSAYKNKFAGTGSTSRSGTITATISAEVVEELPNGKLRIAGHSEIKVNNETQIITITGIIRLQDIDDTNSVKSTALADARIEYYGDGIIGDKQRQGWLARFFDYIWPF